MSGRGSPSTCARRDPDDPPRALGHGAPLPVKRQVNAGATSVTWDGRLDGSLPAPKGTYLVRVTATNQVGTAELTATVRRK